MDENNNSSGRREAGRITADGSIVYRCARTQCRGREHWHGIGEGVAVGRGDVVFRLSHCLLGVGEVSQDVAIEIVADERDGLEQEPEAA